jgi:WD40 repeat protein
MDVADEVQILNVDVTEIAHDKDINSVSVSPNDRFIATGSQDKTAKVSFVPILSDVLRGLPQYTGYCLSFHILSLSQSADHPTSKL